MKTLKDISWQVDEPVYRQDPALSYSTLARYEREGFGKLDSLFSRIETPSLTFGSAVDALITGGQQEFDDNFFVADFPEVKDSIKAIVNHLFRLYKEDYKSLDDIPDSAIIPITEEDGFQSNWKPVTRAKVIREQGFEYYKLLFMALNKTVLDNTTAQQVFEAVRALKTSPATKEYFRDNLPFDDSIREYQLKFKATFNNVDYRCMPDLLITIPEKKLVIPVDLKTSGHPEYEFYKSFITWSYSQQARLYSRIIRANMDKDDEFVNYTLGNYRFVVVNKKTLTPLVWEFKDTHIVGTLTYGKNKDIIIRDPFEIGEELHYYLEKSPAVPKGINVNGINDIVEWLNK